MKHLSVDMSSDLIAKSRWDLVLKPTELNLGLMSHLNRAQIHDDLTSILMRQLDLPHDRIS